VAVRPGVPDVARFAGGVEFMGRLSVPRLAHRVQNKRGASAKDVLLRRLLCGMAPPSRAAFLPPNLTLSAPEAGWSMFAETLTRSSAAQQRRFWTAAAAAAALDCGSSRSRLASGPYPKGHFISTSAKAVAAATALQRRTSAWAVPLLCFWRAKGEAPSDSKAARYSGQC